MSGKKVEIYLDGSSLGTVHVDGADAARGHAQGGHRWTMRSPRWPHGDFCPNHLPATPDTGSTP